ncbi:MAG TPA: VIT domain-containing protein [Gemmatimonadales bacterium]|nr:VIT domain-containing protein [Gemmatimonadales bacterium]
MHRTLKIAVALAVGGAIPAAAQGWIEVRQPVPSPRPVPIGGPVIRVSSDVRISIDGRIARVEVEERFRNAGQSIAEGTYLYPLPGEAVFSGYSLWMGDRELQGEMQTAEQASAIYEEIVRRQRDPALLTYAGHGLIRAQIFPIQPGETRKVVLRYTQVLGREGDALRLRYAIGPRTTGRGQGSDAAPQDQFSLRVTAPGEGAIGTPYSPTHELTTRRTGGQLTVTIPSTATGDLDVLLPLRRGLVGTSILTHASAGEDGYYMLLLAPPESASNDVIPRDLTLVVDISGSMSGTKLEQAKAALAQALAALGPQDRFRVVAFSSSVTEFRTGLTPATRAALADAQEFVSNLSAGGGTNIEGALDVALQSAAGNGRMSLVVFMTDGLPSVGETQPDQIAAAAGSRIGQSRIFTVGVGTDVNTYLLDRLAKEGRGSATYVAPNADMEVAVGGLLGRIRHPALANLRIVSAPVTLTDAQPSQLPDLFYGEELVVFGRYHGTGSGDVVVEGERNGRRERFTARAEFTSREPDNSFVPPLWASRKIGELTRTARLEGASPAIIEEIRQLGLRYGLLTEYTSFLVLEPGAVPPRPEAALQGGRDAAKSMSGQAAFDRAEVSAREAEVKTLASANAVADERLANAPSATGSAAASKRVAGRVFVNRGGAWTDLAYKPGSRTVAVAPFSPAYFALVRALPELAPWLSVGNEVVIAGGRLSIRIDAAGLTEWRGDSLAATVRDFRAR